MLEFSVTCWWMLQEPQAMPEFVVHVRLRNAKQRSIGVLIKLCKAFAQQACCRGAECWSNALQLGACHAAEMTHTTWGAT